MGCEEGALLLTLESAEQVEAGSVRQADEIPLWPLQPQAALGELALFVATNGLLHEFLSTLMELEHCCC